MERDKLKIGFIGFGNMAQAIAEGLISYGDFEANHILVSGRNYEKLLANAKKFGVIPEKSNRDLAEEADIIVLALNPAGAEGALKEVKDLLPGKVLLSIVYGLDNKRLGELVGGVSFQALMPNLPISVGEGILLMEEGGSLSPKEEEVFREIFGKIALIEEIPKGQMSIAGTLIGCSPAFVALFVEALADAGVKYGLSRKLSYDLVSQMTAGSGKMILESGDLPAAIKDRVATPGGTTIRGVDSLEKTGFRASLLKAIDAIEG